MEAREIENIPVSVFNLLRPNISCQFVSKMAATTIRLHTV